MIPGMKTFPPRGTSIIGIENGLINISEIASLLFSLRKYATTWNQRNVEYVGTRDGIAVSSLGWLDY